MPYRIAAEPQDAFNEIARVVGDQQLGLALAFPHHLDAERLAAAVAALVADQPLLGCTFVSAGRRTWHEPVASAPGPCFALVEDADAWPRPIDEAGQPLPPDAAHLAVTLVRGDAADALAVQRDRGLLPAQIRLTSYTPTTSA